MQGRDGLGEELRKLDPFVGDAVDVGRRHLRAAVEPGLPPAYAVGEEQQDIGPLGCSAIRLGSELWPGTPETVMAARMAHIAV